MALHSQIDGAAWTAYTPTVAPAAGASTISAITGFYKQIGKVVHFRASFSLDAVGTGTSYINVALPVAAVAVNTAGSGINATPSPDTALIVGSAGNVRYYNGAGAFPATGTHFVAGTYEAA